MQENHFLTFNGAELVSDHLFSHECCHFADLLFYFAFFTIKLIGFFVFVEFFRLNARFIYKTYIL